MDALSKNFTRLIILMVVSCLCVAILVGSAVVIPMLANRRIANVNLVNQPEKTVLQTIEDRYKTCIEYYLSEAGKCDSLKNQLAEERANHGSSIE